MNDNITWSRKQHAVYLPLDDFLRQSVKPGQTVSVVGKDGQFTASGFVRGTQGLSYTYTLENVFYLNKCWVDEIILEELPPEWDGALVIRDGECDYWVRCDDGTYLMADDLAGGAKAEDGYSAARIERSYGAAKVIFPAPKQEA